MFEHWTLPSSTCIIPPSDILGGLYLGSLKAAKDHKYLLNNEIRAVLTVASGTGLRYSDDVVSFHEVVPAQDVESFDLGKYFGSFLSFLFLDLFFIKLFKPIPIQIKYFR